MPELAKLAEQISANLLSHGLRKPANKLTELIDLTPDIPMEDSEKCLTSCTGGNLSNQHLAG